MSCGAGVKGQGFKGINRKCRKTLNQLYCKTGSSAHRWREKVDVQAKDGLTRKGLRMGPGQPAGDKPALQPRPALTLPFTPPLHKTDRVAHNP